MQSKDDPLVVVGLSPTLLPSDLAARELLLYARLRLSMALNPPLTNSISSVMNPFGFLSRRSSDNTRELADRNCLTRSGGKKSAFRATTSGSLSICSPASASSFRAICCTLCNRNRSIAKRPNDTRLAAESLAAVG